MLKMCVSALLQDEEINQQSQLAEKLKQQMLDQEEVSAEVPTCVGGEQMQHLCSLRGVSSLNAQRYQICHLHLYLTCSGPVAKPMQTAEHCCNCSPIIQ